MPAPSITESQIQTALGNALQEVLPGITIIAGQDNRVSEPGATDFAIFTPILRSRLDTNYTAYSDCAFIATATGTTLNVSAVQFGTIANGAVLFPPFGNPSGLIVNYGGSGSGGVGTYTLSAALTQSTPAVMATGIVTFTQPTEITFQVDFHSPTLSDASDMVASVTTLFRSELATTSALFNSAVTGVWPLHADEARQVPFHNSEQAYETRWSLDVHVQVNQAVAWPQAFASALLVTFIQADA
jgi:hypothetical protein